jgi:hypothetical protein
MSGFGLRPASTSTVSTTRNIAVTTRRRNWLKRSAVAVCVAALMGCSDRPNVFTQTLDERERRLTEERARLETTADAVARTRIQIRIADLRVSFIRDAADSGDMEGVDESIGEYRAAILDAWKTIIQSGRNAHHDARGYMDLEIALRQHVRQLGDIGSSLTFDRREPLERLIAEISEIRGEILSLLFPADTAVS